LIRRRRSGYGKKSERSRLFFIAGVLPELLPEKKSGFFIKIKDGEV